MKISINYSKLATWVLVAICSFGCEDEDENLPKVVAGFTHTINEETGTVTFLNTSDLADQYAWDFGDGETSTEINPIKTYSAGTFYVSLEASNNAGASDVFKDTLNIKGKPSLPLTFDDPSIYYAVTAFSGVSFAIVDNPNQSGTNNKATKVGAITNSGVAYEGIFLNLGSPIDLTTNKTITMNFWAAAPISVLLKLEEGTSSPIETTAAHGGTGWEKISFNFTSSAKYARLTLFVDGPGTTKGTFYFDDVEQKETEVVCTPETAQELSAATFNLTFQTDPGAAIGSFDATYTYANNPNFKNTVNSSCKVGKIDRNGGALFANNQFEFNSKFDFTTKSGFKLKVLSSTVGYTVLVKLEDKTNSSINTELSRTTTVAANQWEELTFPFAGGESGKYDKIILFFQLNTNTTATYFIDDFALYGTGSPAPATSPTTAAPTPPARSAANVIAIFSNAYTNITGVDYNPNWGQGTVTTTINIAGNATLKYANLNYQGTDFSGNPQNASGMEFLHLDYWTANSTALNVYAISPGPVEKAKALTVPTNGNWTSIDIPLADFSPVALNNLIQLKFDGNGDIFLDNIYFYRNSAPATEPATAAPTPPARATGDVISIFSNAYTNITGVDYNPNWGQGTVTTTVSIAGNSTLKYANLNYQGTDFAGNAQNVSAMSFLHVDFWTANSSALNIYIISAGPSEKAKALTVPTNGNWTSVNIPLTDFTPTVNLTNVIQFKFDGNGDIFLDNLYFYKPASGGGGGTTNLASNGDFETGTDSGWLRFQNGGTSVLDNTTNNGGSWSGRLATAGASNPAFKQERIGAGTVKAGDVVRVRFDHKGSLVQPGAVFSVSLFGEGASGASFTHVFNPAPSPSATWSTFTGTYTIPSGTDVSQGISFLIEAVCGGSSGCSVTANIDNVSVVLNP